jgi:hypothetical protein
MRSYQTDGSTRLRSRSRILPHPYVVVGLAREPALVDRVLEEGVQLRLEVLRLPLAAGGGQRERALARRLDEAVVTRESIDEPEHRLARELAAGVRDQLLLDPLLGRLEDLAAHREAHVVVEDESDEARQVGREVDAALGLLVRAVGIAGDRDPTEPGERDLVEDDQGLVVVLDAVAAELDALDRAEQGFLEEPAPPTAVPREAGLEALEETLRQDAPELGDRLPDEARETGLEPLEPRHGGGLVRVHLVELAQARRRRLRGARRVLVPAVEVAAEREEVEDAAALRAALPQDRVAEVDGDRVRAIALAPRVPVRLRSGHLDEQPVPHEHREARLEVVAGEVREALRVQEVEHAGLIARAGEVEVEDRGQALPERGGARLDGRGIRHPLEDLLPDRDAFLGHPRRALARPEAEELGEVRLPDRGDGVARVGTPGPADPGLRGDAVLALGILAGHRGERVVSRAPSRDFSSTIS